MLARIDDSLTDTGPKKSGPERLCAVTREVKPVAELLRFVVAPDGSVVPDLKRKLPGRGLWVTATREALAEAVKRKIFGKGFKQDVRTGAELIALTENLLERAALDALAIAGKAGQVVAGFMKTEAAIGRSQLLAVLHARDAADDGVRKLNAALHRRFEGEESDILTISDFTSQQLDLALGRANVVHAALLAGPAGNSFIARYLRMTRFRTGGTGKPDRNNARREPQGLEAE
jgi:predicted RNA-binding protein YlxR (DUF448 family)